MTKEIYNKSIKTGELQLVGFGAIVSHYVVVGYIMILPAMVFCFHLPKLFDAGDLNYNTDECWFTLISTIATALIFWLQKHRLQFKIVKTDLEKVMLKMIVNDVAKDLKWHRKTNSANVYTATRYSEFFRWEKVITILYYKNSVWINIISEPHPKAWLFSLWWSKKDERILVNEIKKAERKPKVEFDETVSYSENS